MRYTLAQIRGFLGAIARKEQQDWAMEAIAARQAAHADGKGFEAFVDRLAP